MKPIAFVGSAVVILGLIQLGLALKDGSSKGSELPRAVALIAAGGVILGVAVIYGFCGFQA